MLIGPLFSGAIDVVGDIHGEFGALQSLLERLGYRPDGVHPQGRRLVFVGDLVDRGPRSWSVVRFVQPLLEAGLAQCVMGNHELNLLLDERKHGNDWFFGPPSANSLEQFGVCEWLREDEQAAVAAVLQPLPFVLERTDLRVVHASWSASSIDWCRARMAAGDERPVALMYRELDRTVEQAAEVAGLLAAKLAEAERMGPFSKDKDCVPPLRPAFAAYEVFLQMRHPLAMLCSGQEQASVVPFWASGKWRMTDRTPWWRHYQEAVPVVFGHYWRWVEEAARRQYSRGEPDLFAGCEVRAPLPTQAAAAWCADFSVGARYRQRMERVAAAQDPEAAPFAGRLAALRWPEREWVFDTP